MNNKKNNNNLFELQSKSVILILISKYVNNFPVSKIGQNQHYIKYISQL